MSPAVPAHPPAPARRATAATAVLACLLVQAAGIVAAADPDVANTILEDLRAADAARAAQAAAEDAWAGERERLAATRQALVAAAADLSTRRQAADAARAAAEATTAPGGDDAAATRAVLQRIADTVRACLAATAVQVPPGTLPALPPPGDPAAALRALAAAEHAAGAVTTAVIAVPGAGAGAGVGESRAVRMLRIGGACAWWSAIDGSDAGPLVFAGDTLRTDPAPDAAARRAILDAFAMVDGRLAPALITLPGDREWTPTTPMLSAPTPAPAPGSP